MARVVIEVLDKEDGRVSITATSEPSFPGPAAPEGCVESPAQRLALLMLGNAVPVVEEDEED